MELDLNPDSASSQLLTFSELCNLRKPQFFALSNGSNRPYSLKVVVKVKFNTPCKELKIIPGSCLLNNL
jgi:hypothetical protein